MARELGIGVEIFAQWKTDHADFAAALVAAQDYWHGLAEDNLKKLIKGYTVEETEATIEGVPPRQHKRVKKTIRHVPPNAHAITWMIKNRASFKLMKEIERGMPEGLPANLSVLFD